MPIVLDHLIMESNDLDESVKWYEDVFGFSHEIVSHEFVERMAVVKVTDEFVILITPSEEVHTQHYAFAMNPDEFKTQFQKVKDLGLPYGDGSGGYDSTEALLNMQAPGREPGARGEGDSVYVVDPSGHQIEFMAY